MPELPDVEVFKRYIDSTSLHKNITHVTVSNKKILEDISQKELKKVLLDTSFDSTERHGKYLFLKTDSETWVVLHFGMTGFVRYYKKEEEQPSHTRVLFSFDNGYHLAFHNQRLLGKISLTDDKEEYVKTIDLGIDALTATYDDFYKLYSDKKRMVKSALMDQSLLAGIGNIYADEILFQSGIHPKTKMNHLDENALKTMYEHMKEIFSTAIKANVNPDDFPDNFIIPHRKKNGVCPKDDETLKTTKVNNRTTYYCPVHQKK